MNVSADRLRRDHLHELLTDLGIPPEDLKIDVFATNSSRGFYEDAPGIRLTHLPTGLQVSYSDGRTQTESLIMASARLVHGLWKAREG